MLEFFSVAPYCRAAPATGLAVAGVTNQSIFSIYAPVKGFARLLVFAFGAWLATACTAESSPEQPATPASGSVVEEMPEESASPDDDNDECRKMQDMWDALPKLETYKQLKRTDRQCLPASGMLSYKFTAKDDNSGALMSVSLIDENRFKDSESAYTKSAKDAYQSTKDPAVRKSTLGVGDMATVVAATMSETDSGGKFMCVFKGHYYFQILVSLPGKSLATPEAIESFVTQYVKQIDPSKLK